MSNLMDMPDEQYDQLTDEQVTVALWSEFRAGDGGTFTAQPEPDDSYYCGLHGLCSLSNPCSCHPAKDDRVSWEVTPEGIEIDTTPGEDW